MGPGPADNGASPPDPETRTPVIDLRTSGGSGTGRPIRSLADLHRTQSELWQALRGEEDPDRRMALLSQLSDTRAAIMAHSGMAPGNSGGPGPVTVRAEAPAAARPSVTPPGRPRPSEPPVSPSFDTSDHGEPFPLNGSRPAPRRPPSMFLPVADPGAVEPSGTQPLPSAPPPPSAHDAVARPGVAPHLVDVTPAGSEGERPGSGATPAAQFAARLQSGLRQIGDPQSGQRMLVLVGALVSAIAVSWLVLSRATGTDETAAGNELQAGETVGEEDAVALKVAEIAAVVSRMGLATVTVEQRGDTIHLGGTVGTDAERVTVVGVVEALVAGEIPVTSEIGVVSPSTTVAAAVDDSVTARGQALQSEINRLVAATPLIFDTGATELTELHVRILNNVATVLRAYPGFPVKVVGFADHVGPASTNAALSLARAESVKAYLVAQGVPETDLSTEARGSTTSTGSSELASLERRVEFEVVVPAALPQSTADVTMRVAVVAPSASNDLAFTQSMVDAVRAIAADRGGVQVDITDNTFVPEEAAAAIRAYADGGADLIIAHGVEFGTELRTIVTDHPDVVFAWGTATDTFGLPNLYAYDAAAEEGGFVMGAMAARLSAGGNVGVVGPIEVADAVRYVEGFKAGVVSQNPAAQVPVVYTGSFNDIAAASDVATAHIGAGADVLTGTAEMVVGAIAVAREQGVPWFGTQANQASLAPEVVVASQVYHWEVLLREVVADVDAGTPQGRSLVATLANGGLRLEYNPSYPLPAEVRQLGDELAAGVAAGTVAVPRPG